VFLNPKAGAFFYPKKKITDVQGRNEKIQGKEENP
jgi:hypothetical protein